MNHLHLSNSEFSILSSSGHFHSEDLLSHLLDIGARLLPAHKPDLSHVMKELKTEEGLGHETDWEAWYKEQMHDSLESETQRMTLMIECMITSLSQLKQEDISNYCRERLITDSFIGTEAKHAILQKLALEHHSALKMANKDSAYDGYINNQPVIIKHYHTAHDDSLEEMTQASTIFYELHEDEIELMYEIAC
ncbi:MjaI family restriction endonuclease [Lentisphaera profundi]|uniref:MjaI family restriction endonuclease n=1 Tax=Lentisphaera profundi TaxID=1658616 RepID=A0ABY7VXH3_9BACT|nr:MjaI family restriction endonuclease [Lentisphaera profundi]WDE97979.1 MjaI family restriction endonuclease [Lentisphaera profundi]